MKIRCTSFVAVALLMAVNDAELIRMETESGNGGAGRAISLGAEDNYR